MPRLCFWQVEKLHDEGMQLKMLQTTLTLLQSPAHAHLEVGTDVLRIPRRDLWDLCLGHSICPGAIWPCITGIDANT